MVYTIHVIRIIFIQGLLSWWRSRPRCTKYACWMKIMHRFGTIEIERCGDTKFDSKDKVRGFGVSILFIFFFFFIQPDVFFSSLFPLSVSCLFPFREMVTCQRSPSILLFSTSYYLDICCSATHFQVFSLVLHSLSVWKLSCIICAIYASSCEQEQIVNPSCHGTLFTTFRHCPSRLSFTIVHAILQLCLFALANSRSYSYIYSCSTGKSLSGPSPI